MTSMGDDIIHRRKLFGGRITAHEIHAKYAWNNRRCDACGGPTAIRVQIFVALRDMSAAVREAVEVEIALGRIHAKSTINGPAVRTSFMHACSGCSMAAERAAARGPSFAMIDIDRGPGVDKPVVGVIGSII